MWTSWSQSNCWVLECERYHVRTLMINKDTPENWSLWEVTWFTLLFDNTDERIQQVHPERTLLTSNRLTGMYNGHFSQLAQLIRQDRTFVKRIQCVHIDEAYNIYITRLPYHGGEAFHPAYGRLGEFGAILPAGVPFQVLSATFPSHIRRVFQDELAMSANHVSITLSTNCPNIQIGLLPLQMSTAPRKSIYWYWCCYNKEYEAVAQSRLPSP